MLIYLLLLMQVMEKLLELPSDFWCKILDLDDISLYPADTPGTPDTPSCRGG